MTPLANAMLAVFVAAWFVGVGGVLFGSFHFLRIGAAAYERRKPDPKAVRKCLLGLGVFVVAWCVAGAAGLVAQMWAGGWR